MAATAPLIGWGTTQAINVSKDGARSRGVVIQEQSPPRLPPRGPSSHALVVAAHAAGVSTHAPPGVSPTSATPPSGVSSHTASGVIVPATSSSSPTAHTQGGALSHSSQTYLQGGGGGAPAALPGSPEEATYALVVAAAPRARDVVPTMRDKVLGGLDTAATYWIPNAARSEFGLLEAIERRGGNAGAFTGDGGDCADPSSAQHGKNFVLVASRPAEELAKNFSNHNGDRVKITGDVFKYSRTSLALEQLRHAEAAAHGTQVSLNQVRAAMATALPKLQENEYYLVSYRDYSAWAVSRFPDEVKRERYFAAGYVERFFAIRVGQTEGVFIPISEPQFRQGWEKITVMRMRRHGSGGEVAVIVSGACDTNAPQVEGSVALTEDQFKSLAGIRSTSSPKSGSSNNRAAGGRSDASDEFHGSSSGSKVPWWDVRRQAQRWMRRKMEALGIAVVKMVVMGVLLGVGVYAIRRALLTAALGGSSSNNGEATSTGKRGSPTGGFFSRSSSGRHEPSSIAPQSQSDVLFATISSASPKAIFNLLLGAPPNSGAL